jgi:hypothetical protein
MKSRARKTSTTPTKIYTYGCLPPIEGEELFNDQLFKAHRYRNGLVEIELKRRERVREAQAKHSDLGPLVEKIDSLNAEFERLRLEMVASKNSDGVIKVNHRAAIQVIKRDRSVLYQLLWWAKKIVTLRGDMQQEYDAIEEEYRGAIKTLRAGEDIPYWGTYLKLEEIAQVWRQNPSPPIFKRYDGSGRCVVQLQGGLAITELVSNDDTRLRLAPGTPRPTKRHPEGLVKEHYRTLWIRVGSDGRAPRWAKFPLVLHRPLPDDAQIKWAWVYRRRVGVRYRFECQITLESQTFLPAPRSRESDTVVAVDIGARGTAKGLRAGLWLDSSGEKGEVLIPQERLSSPTSRGHERRHLVPNDDLKLESIRAIRDQHFDKIKLALIQYRTVPNVPEWYMLETVSLDKWKSARRVARLFRLWQRHDGDKLLYEDWLPKFLKKDRHLLDWEALTSRRSRHRRREMYRVFAAKLAKEYSTIVVAKRSFIRERRDIEKSPVEGTRVATGEVEKTISEQEKQSRVHGRSASPGELHAAIKSAAKAAGVQFIEARLENDDSRSWALSERICKELLLAAASAEVVGDPAVPLAEEKIEGTPAVMNKPRSVRKPGNRRRVDPLAPLVVDS